jgi:SAM-dependent methyltransferase
MTALRSLKRLIVYAPPDPVRFWRARAEQPGWQSVMWANPTYNACADDDQWRAIERSLPDRRRSVLDLGCGTGRLSARLSAVFDQYVGLDLDSMIREARLRNPTLAHRYVVSRVQSPGVLPERFDLVLSMACIGNSCRADELPSVAQRLVDATRPGGRVIMLDAFHRTPALARNCRVSARHVIEIFTNLGMQLVQRNALCSI